MSFVRKESQSGDSSSDGEEDFVPYSERSEWSDIKPVPQIEAENAIVTIAYSSRFRDVFDYFRAILAKDERSDRAFDLTTDCIALNPSNFTVWYFRRILLQSLKKDLREELRFLENVILDNHKNYQVWQHRKALIQMLNEASDEKRFTEDILKIDSKNYHCWQHRQWFVQQFNLWDGELQFLEQLINDDIRNNSAWNHRFFVINNTCSLSDMQVVEQEVNFTISKIKLTPHNESAWNYLRGILRECGLNKLKQVMEMCNELYSEPNRVRSSHLVAFMIDCIEETLDKQCPRDNSLIEQAVSMANEMATIDTIRTNYWNHVARSVHHTYTCKQ
ncbi:protein farnesyltransferase/geranylgeranyltransferase type-1 subunit alpha-like protein [Leptotrombidium deliense]|uniref:Protein farnesyltransferase/geranylgeranyltransferase type-1 subunit alpha n=1 Tax=Leptotrombidium deliense TaxID=299467 RepID=A0A443SWG1_9ACAR|nr:protein farnesyltransferase/geranylgeranyltransferase type-1 subunit alpha-like protein [Leptotrombidium deliense]